MAFDRILSSDVWQHLYRITTNDDRSRNIFDPERHPIVSLFPFSYHILSNDDFCACIPIEHNIEST